MVSEKLIERCAVPGALAGAPTSVEGRSPKLPDRAKQLVDRLDHLLLEDVGGASRKLTALSVELIANIDASTFSMVAPSLLKACSEIHAVGSFSDAIQLGRKIMFLSSQTSDFQIQRRVNNILGACYIDTADFPEAMSCLQSALELAKKIGDPFLETVCLSNVVVLMQEMGHYQQTINLARRITQSNLGSEANQLRLQVASSGLFAAHRIGDRKAASYFAEIGNKNLSFAMSDVSRAFFERERALYLADAGLLKEAKAFVERADSEIGGTENQRVKILLAISAQICAWAEGAKGESRRVLSTIYLDTRQSRLLHHFVLQTLVKVYSDSETSEDVAAGLKYARELVEYTTSVKKAKFYRQLGNKRDSRDVVESTHTRSEIDPFGTVRDWLIQSEVAPPLEDDSARRHEVTKHEELTAIHEDMAKLRVASIRREIRTDAVSTAENWAVAAEFFDDETGRHCYRVGHLASLLARRVGMDDTFCLQIELAARLHDIGKIAVNEVILLKPGPLDAAEMAAMRLHTEVGAQILAGSDDPTLRMATEIARHHHEWWNGKGYPTNLAAKNIPVAARICAFADVYDALTNIRAYKAAWTHERAVAEITRLSGTQFDPDFLESFVEVLASYRVDLARDAIPGFADMNSNALISSRKKLLETISE